MTTQNEQYEPFAVQIFFSSPVIRQENTELTLDAVLAAAINMETGDIERAHRDIPLKRSGPLWHGSSLFLVNPTPIQAPFIANLSAVRNDCDGYSGKIQRAGGDFRAFVDKYDAYAPEYAVWFGCGDLSAVERLLRLLPGIGKKSAQGYGQIKEYLVIPIPRDRSLMLEDGTPARPVPLSIWEQIPAARGGRHDAITFRPPYWDTRGTEMCAIPSGISLPSERIAALSETGGEEIGDISARFQPSGFRWQSGIDFFHEFAGRYLQPHAVRRHTAGIAESCDVCGSTTDLQRTGGGEITMCGACASFGGGYDRIVRPGRMGAGWAGLVTKDRTRLVTSVDYPKSEKPFPGADLDLQCGKPALSQFPLVLLNLPEPPFLLFYSGNSTPAVIRSLEITWSLDRVRISGERGDIINVPRILSALDRWRKSGIKAKPFSDAFNLNQRQREAISVKRRESLSDELTKLLAKHAGLNDLLAGTADLSVTDFRYLNQLINLGITK